MAKVEKFALHVPNLEELSGVLQDGLKENFADVQVSVVDCPDLTRDPFNFPVKGICGKPRLVDVGGVPYLVPLVQKDKFIPVVQAESEQKPAINASYIALINPADGGCLLEKYSDKYSDCEFGLLANLYASEGQPGKVIEVKASERTGQHNFVTCMRKIIEKCYGDKPVGMGGTFVIQKGKAKIHIMPPEFSACPLNTDEDVNNWLAFFEMKAPLICQPVLISRDPGFDLRVEHTHCFSHHGEGGHYHNDTTPDSVQYLGYFLPAELVFRIDRPKESHMIGRD
ncbi:ester hydrolase C11orf54 homolog isoform X2 [Carettochelys insculpta]|uniref:ester hydrolase C11orf54 homolog isoform X2 n=1 Tax=Carettochelys insculpta TaxID=44489 RepID=UPI003EBDFBDC